MWAVLPDVLERQRHHSRDTGASSVYPNAIFGDIALAAALRNWALSIHVAAADRGVQIARIAINAWLGNQPGAEADLVAPLYRQAHEDHRVSELVFTPHPGAQRRGRTPSPLARRQPLELLSATLVHT